MVKPKKNFSIFLCHDLIILLLIIIGHTHIDILKIDIEGWEFETITTLVTPYIASGNPLPFGQLQLEIHIWQKTFEDYLTWWETLEKAGLRPFWTEVRFPHGWFCSRANIKSASLA